MKIRVLAIIAVFLVAFVVPTVLCAQEVITEEEEAIDEEEVIDEEEAIENDGDKIPRELFIYSPGEREGLHAAYRDFDGVWHHIGQLCSTMASGEQKNACMSHRWYMPATAPGVLYGN